MYCRASLVAQWLRICLPMQGTWVWALVWEDPTCRGATKPVCHNYWACALEPMSHNCWARVPQLLKPARLEPVLRNKRSHRASLVAQWLRVCLPMQGTRVRALVWEDPTCRGATGPVSHNCWACTSGAWPATREAAMVRGPRTAMKSGPHLPQLEKALAEKRRPNTAKNK